MTADSFPSRAAHLGVECAPATDARLIADVLSEVAVHARAQRRRDLLHEVDQAFGRHLFEAPARSGIEAARARAQRLSHAGAGLSPSTAVAYAADVFVAIAVERCWRVEDANVVICALQHKLGTSEEDVRLRLLVLGLHAPQLGELPPLVALEVQLSLLISLSAVVEASIWTTDETARLHCVCEVGPTAQTRRFRSVAREILDGDTPETGTIVGTAIRRWQAPWGALVARLRGRDDVAGLLDEVAASMSVALEREFLLQRSAARERALVTASERRLSRLGFDLHDGALQEVAALSLDIAQLRHRAPTLGADLDEVQGRLTELDRTLRELAHSLEPASLLRRPLEAVVEAEAASLRKRTGMSVSTRISGEFSAMTQSQKIALIRVVQEALTNIREHSNASTVDLVVRGSRSSVDVQIQDDGDGFEVTRTLQDAAQRGRLGLVGGSERVRLLGGTFDVRSRPGGPTTVSLTLPRWQPLIVEQDSPSSLAFS